MSRRPCALSEESVLRMLAETKALLEGHFLLSSGLHSDRYMQCARVLARPDYAEALGAALAALLPEKPDLVVSPAMGGIVIGQEVARALRVRHFFAEREDGVMTLRRGFAVERGEKVAVVEDVVTTGKSTGEVLALLQGLGAVPTAALCLVCRAAEAPPLGVPVMSLAHLPLKAHPPQDCPLCRTGQPLVKPGSRTVKK